MAVKGLRAAAAAAPTAVAVLTTTVLGAWPAAAQDASMLMRSAQFAPPTAFVPPAAVTYDTAAVPAGAKITVASAATTSGTERKTEVELAVSGLRPDRTYGAHVHTRPCGYEPDGAGDHYQHRTDPVRPSVAPDYANAANEVWLDFTTGGDGRGHAEAKQRWRFRADGAGSVVLHEHGTRTGEGEAGTAGARVACFSVPFK